MPETGLHAVNCFAPVPSAQTLRLRLHRGRDCCRTRRNVDDPKLSDLVIQVRLLTFYEPWIEYPISSMVVTRIGLKTLSRCFLRRNLAHGLAKPHMTRIGVESRMPGHEEMKRVQFLRCLHEPQPAIVFDN